MTPPASQPSIDGGRIAWLLAGGVALVAGTLLGWNGELLARIATPPALVRAVLVGASVVVALWLLARAVQRMEDARHLGTAELTGRDMAGLIRGVRYVFLAIAALAAGLGWLIGHPLPFVVALIIAGVDILETTFLLLVVAFRREV